VAWKAGAISRDTMFDLFRMGDVLPVGRSNDEEKALVQSQAPKVQSPAAAAPAQAQPPTKNQ
jgi:hypothetical protein